jgi:hypothetical protein
MNNPAPLITDEELAVDLATRVDCRDRKLVTQLVEIVSVYGFLDTFFVHQAATFTASFWMARTAAGVL